jgi:hypothetical protein
MIKGSATLTRAIAVALMVLLSMMAIGCGGGGSGDGNTTASLSGIVINPLAGGDPVPVGAASVRAYRFDDSTLISSTTSAASGETGTFTLTDLPKNVEIYLKAEKTGHINANTRANTLSADVTGVAIIILPDDNTIALDVLNRLYNKNESSWNSTLQEAAYIVMDAENTSGDDLAGLTIDGDHIGSGSSLEPSYASNLPDGSGTYIGGFASSTVARADTNALPMVGAVVNVDLYFGGYALTGSLSGGTLEESAINAPVIQGEITYFVWYEE